jgi:hypothetical protein
MKIKTVVFWILWVGNDFILQTIRERDPEPASPPSFPSHCDDIDLPAAILKELSDQAEPDFSAEERTT